MGQTLGPRAIQQMREIAKQVLFGNQNVGARHRRVYRARGSRSTPCPERNEIIQLTVIGQPTTGTLDYTQTISGTPDTVTFNFDDTSTEIQAALESHSEIAAGQVSVTGGPLPNATVTIEFTSGLGGINHPIPTLNWTNLTGGTGVAVIVSVDTQGHPN